MSRFRPFELIRILNWPDGRAVYGRAVVKSRIWDKTNIPLAHAKKIIHILPFLWCLEDSTLLLMSRFVVLCHLHCYHCCFCDFVNCQKFPEGMVPSSPFQRVFVIAPELSLKMRVSSTVFLCFLTLHTMQQHLYGYLCLCAGTAFKLISKKVIHLQGYTSWTAYPVQWCILWFIIIPILLTRSDWKIVSHLNYCCVHSSFYYGIVWINKENLNSKIYRMGLREA